MHLDDLRLALQFNQVINLSQDLTDTLGYFDTNPEVWELDANRHVEAFQKINNILKTSIEIVILNHIAINTPIILEGDGFGPDLVDSSSLRCAFEQGQLKTAFIIPDRPQLILTNLTSKCETGLLGSDENLHSKVNAKWSYGLWLRDQANDRSFPVVSPLPYSTLVTRIEHALGVSIT